MTNYALCEERNDEICEECGYNLMDCVCSYNRELESRLILEFEEHNLKIRENK